jgi:zinc transport system substrate-binding protein
VVVALAAALMAAGLVAACSAAVPTTLATPLRVSAQPFALAEVARRVGLGRVVVSGSGGLVLTAGANGDPWLDPVAMEAVTAHVADQLSGADPGGRAAYQEAASVYEAQLSALNIDYQSSLADCGRHDVVTEDDAFVPTGSRYGFADHAATDAGVAALIRSKGIPVVFSETLPPPASVSALAQEAHTKVGYLDTLTSVTAAEEAEGATYVSLMTDNLAALSAALSCAAPT